MLRPEVFDAVLIKKTHTVFPEILLIQNCICVQMASTSYAHFAVGLKLDVGCIVFCLEFGQRHKGVARNDAK